MNYKVAMWLETRTIAFNEPLHPREMVRDVLSVTPYLLSIYNNPNEATYIT